MGRRKKSLWVIPIIFGYSLIKDVLSWDPWVPGKKRRKRRNKF